MSSTAHANGSRSSVHTVVTTLAAVFHLLALFVICFVLMPRVDRSIHETEKTHEAIQKNNRMLDNQWKELEQHRTVIRRLSVALDAAEARAKALAEKGKKK